jgi:type I restriction enzyme S subunit
VRQWTRCTVGDVLAGIVAGKSPQAAGRPAATGERGVLKVSAVSWGRFRPEENKALPSSYVVSEGLTVRAGDLLISRANTVELVGAVVMATRDHPDLMLSDKTLRLDVRDDLVDKRFLLYALRTQEVRAVFEEDATGTSDSMRNLSQDKIRSAPLALPPLDVQRRIVAKLDELLAQSRAAREQLEAVPALVEQYRQSVLAAAFRGDLTKEWREKNPDVEPASKLLERMRAERRRQWEAAELAKMKAKGKAPKDEKWKAKYEEPELVDTSDLPELPPSWCWAALEELSEWVTDGTHQSPRFTDQGVPFVVIGNLRRDGVDWSSVSKWVARDVYEELTRSCRPGVGDVLYSAVGSYGMAVAVDDPRPFCFQRHIAHVVQPKGLMPSLLARFLSSPDLKRRADLVARGNAQKTVTLGELRRFPIPIPPEAEQRAMRDLLDGCLAAVAAVEEQLEGVEVDALERSLLAKAFRGELDLDGTDEEVVRLPEAAADVGAKGRGGRRTA